MELECGLDHFSLSSDLKCVNSLQMANAEIFKVLIMRFLGSSFVIVVSFDFEISSRKGGFKNYAAFPYRRIGNAEILFRWQMSKHCVS